MTIEGLSKATEKDFDTSCLIKGVKDEVEYFTDGLDLNYGFIEALVQIFNVNEDNYECSSTRERRRATKENNSIRWFFIKNNICWKKAYMVHSPGY